jgi:dihydroorotate dehydrogenase
VVGQAGGLSGAPLRDLSLKTVKEFYALTNGKIPIIGCGGISNGSDALAFARAGASAVQVYTAMGYQGPGIVGSVKKEVLDLLEGGRWVDVVGKDHRK